MLKDELVALLDKRPHDDDDSKWSYDRDPDYLKVDKMAGENNFEISLGAQYDAPPKITFANLKAISDLFGTDNVDVDDYGRGGCESCDWGSDYGHTIQIYDATLNVEEMKELVGKDLLVESKKTRRT